MYITNTTAQPLKVSFNYFVGSRNRGITLQPAGLAGDSAAVSDDPEILKDIVDLASQGLITIHGGTPAGSADITVNTPAHVVISLSAIAVAGNTVTIGQQTYTAIANTGNDQLQGNFKIGANAADSVTNLKAAINKWGKGYYAGEILSGPAALVVYSERPGAVDNGKIAVAVVGAPLSVSSATLDGGQESEALYTFLLNKTLVAGDIVSYPVRVITGLQSISVANITVRDASGVAKVIDSEVTFEGGVIYIGANTDAFAATDVLTVEAKGAR